MKLNLHSAAFNTETLAGGGTPAWGTEMGQGEGYRFHFDDSATLLESLIYTSVANPQARVTCPLGKGGKQAADYEFVIAGLYEKIFVNGIHVPGAKFLLLVIKKLVGNNHVGRRTLKYNPNMTLDGVNHNRACYDAIAGKLGVSAAGSWFISEINVRNQDELHFTAHVLDSQGKTTFADTADRNTRLGAAIAAHANLNGNKGLLRFANLFTSRHPVQQIFYGAPGTGKSFAIDTLAPAELTIRTTFHPDSDYASFVGGYKPTMENARINAVTGGCVQYATAANGHPGTEQRIVYKYVPQAFLKAYVAAWSDLSRPHFLVIEEINRGNCAQIFGDMFQLLDRNNSGCSSYAINADEEITRFLSADAGGFADLSYEAQEEIRTFVLRKDNGDTLPVGADILAGKLMLLPPNLHIWATMNTSDQSLFPIDSAFKRRWDWRYMPIAYDKENWTFLAGGHRYRWGDFLRRINPVISEVTMSTDKQMGFYFAKPDGKSDASKAANDTISEKTFVNKVLFYLWNDVLKDFGAGHELFLNPETGHAHEFGDFFDPAKNSLAQFIGKLGLQETNDNPGNA